MRLGRMCRRWSCVPGRLYGVRGEEARRNELLVVGKDFVSGGLLLRGVCTSLFLFSRLFSAFRVAPPESSSYAFPDLAEDVPGERFAGNLWLRWLRCRLVSMSKVGGMKGG